MLLCCFRNTTELHLLCSGVTNCTVLLLWSPKPYIKKYLRKTFHDQSLPCWGRARRRPTQRWSCRPSVGRCCGCAPVRVAGAEDWRRLSEDTGDTLVKDTVIAGAGVGVQPRRGAKSRAKLGSKAARDEWTEEKKKRGSKKEVGDQEVGSWGKEGRGQW